jgi:predicted RNA binding protein YcfA (HicA-like mRNA interferase family)
VPLRPLPYREVRRKREAAGFAPISQRGSHVKFTRRSNGELRSVVVPNHREVAVGTLRSILRQAGLSVEDFESL